MSTFPSVSPERFAQQMNVFARMRDIETAARTAREQRDEMLLALLVECIEIRERREEERLSRKRFLERGRLRLVR